MSDTVILYSSHSITFEELGTAILVAGGNIVHSPGKGYRLLGRVEDGERIVYLFGDMKSQSPEHFWKERLLTTPEEILQAVEAGLGEKPVIDFLLQIGHTYGSGLLAVELAYQCASRWPCVVWAETWDVLQGDYVVTVYTKEAMERVRAERTTFTSTMPVILDVEG
jgi:hypothetical protein